jgi:exodeoxyribonuclease V alpha subunit
MFLQEYGISPAYSARIYRAFGDKTIDEIRNNPYRLADEVFGIGFKTADRIAMSMGVSPDSRYRVSSGIKYVLSRCATGGHTFVPETELKEYAVKLLAVDASDIENALISLVIDKSVYVEKDSNATRVYLNSLYHSEVSVARKLAELSSASFSGDLRGFEER